MAKKSGEMVTLACKLPHGLILTLQEKQQVKIPALGQGVVVEEMWRPMGESITVNGNAVAPGQSINYIIIGGYALTPNVPKDFWDKWLEQNRQLDLVRNKLIFAQGSEERARDQAKEQKAIRSGLEPLDGKQPEKDPRAPKSIFRIAKATAGDGE